MPQTASVWGARSEHRVDLGLLRRRREFGLLVLGQTGSEAGSMPTFVAVPFQAYELTGSSLAVGLLGVAEFVPILGLALVGGALADAFDRRRLVQIAEAARARRRRPARQRGARRPAALGALRVRGADGRLHRRAPPAAGRARAAAGGARRAQGRLGAAVQLPQHGGPRRSGARRRADRGRRVDRHLRGRRRQLRGARWSCSPRCARRRRRPTPKPRRCAPSSRACATPSRART